MMSTTGKISFNPPFLVNPMVDFPRVGDPPPHWTPATTTYMPYRLTDADIDRIAERIIEKIEARGIEIVAATRPDEV